MDFVIIPILVNVTLDGQELYVTNLFVYKDVLTALVFLQITVLVMLDGGEIVVQLLFVIRKIVKMEVDVHNLKLVIVLPLVMREKNVKFPLVILFVEMEDFVLLLDDVIVLVLVTMEQIVRDLFVKGFKHVLMVNVVLPELVIVLVQDILEDNAKFQFVNLVA
jgi:hypothetical protein